jgi:nucleotide-binding universal stress UspA family protein
MTPYSIQNILVPMDLSETSFNALHTAISLAEKHKADLHLLYVEESLPGITDHNTDSFLSREANLDVLLALAGSLKQKEDVFLAVLEEEGDVVECVIKTAIKTQSDLIVMGTHGASGFRDGFIGSNSYGVIKYSTCPVLTIPPKRKFTSFQKVLFPIKPISGAFLPYDIASQFFAANSLIDVLGLSYLNIERETNVLDKIVNEFRELWEGNKVKIQTSWSLGTSVSNDILHFAQQSNPELIVLTSVLDAIPKTNFIGPNAQKVINRARVPVLHIKKAGVHAVTKVA